jgi:neutral ceramidase
MTVPLGGYAARKDAPAVSVHDPIYARAVVLSDGKQTVRLVSVDLCFVPASLRDAVLAHLKTPKANLFLCATHTHSAPDPLAMHAGNTIAFPGFSRFDAALRDQIAKGIAQAVIQAERRLQPAVIEARTKNVTGLNRNRRGEKSLDTELGTVQITTGAGKPCALLVNFAAHPTIYGEKMREISADWCGLMTTHLDSIQGADAVTLFLNGAEGDASPVVDSGKNDEDRVFQYAARMSDAVVELNKAKAMPQTPTLGYREHVFTLPPRKPNGLFYAAAASLGASIPQAKQFVDSLMPRQTRLTLASMGKVLLMGLPCEPTAELGLKAKALARAAGWQFPLVVALTNDWLGYALMPAQYRNGGYETGMSFYGEQFGATLLKELGNALKLIRPAAQE